MKTRIEHKIHAIADVLFRDMKDGKLDNEGVGLLAGQTGIIIFCKHYLQVFPNSEKEEILEGFLETYFDKLTSEIGLFTYCGGLTGALEGLKYLNRERLLEIDYSDVEKNYRELLQTFAINSILNGNYDYLHGGLGIVKYYCDDAELRHWSKPLKKEIESTNGNLRWDWTEASDTISACHTGCRVSYPY